MTGPLPRVAWYRFRATFAGRRGSYLTVLLLVTLVGGIAMGSIAAARRTDSSFATFVKSTNASDLVLIPGPANPADNYSPALTRELAHLPGVKHVEDASIQQQIFPLGPDGLPRLSANALKNVSILASVNGLGFTQDRVSVVAGRMADPSNPDEVMMPAAAARLLGAHLGSTMTFGIYTAAQLNSLPSNGIPAVKPFRTVHVKFVGLIVWENDVVYDDIDQYPTEVLFTPALARELLSPPFLGGEGWTEYGLQLDRGAAGVSAVEHEIGDALPQGTLLLYHVTSLITVEAHSAIAPEVITLWVLGLIAAFAAFVLVLQAVSRQLQTLEEDREVMRALGADRPLVASEGLIGIIGAVAIGAPLAAVVAVALSPLSPIGPVRPVYPTPGIAFDWTVIGMGPALLFLILALASVGLAFRATFNRAARRGYRTVVRPSSAVRATALSGLPPSAVAGMNFALAPGTGRSSAPVRSAMSGAMLAVIILVATLTFGASLGALVSHPALYGWNWSYALEPQSDPVSYVPAQLQSFLRNDHEVAAWTTVVFSTLNVDGQVVPFMFEPPGSSIAPPLLSGHEVEGPDQIVIGPATLAALHKHVGDSVVIGAQGRQGTVRVVGEATFPAIGVNGTFHPSTGTGAVASSQVLPPPDRVCGPAADMVLIRMRPGTSSAAALAGTEQIASETNHIFAKEPTNTDCSDDLVSVLSVQRPAEIVNYRSIGSTPGLLAAALTVAAAAALGLTLVASARRRRRDMATLKALGFTRRQLLSAVCWQASILVGVGVIAGVPLGTVLGRWSWVLFARDIYVVPEPAVPVLSLVLVVLGALVFANLVATLPGRIAARTPVAIVFRSE